MKNSLQKNSNKSFALDKALGEYSVLKARVGEVLIEGRSRIEREFLRMRYHTGLLINEHVRLNGDRAAYGTKAILKLEKDFQISHSELQRYAQFSKSYPNAIVADQRQLAFSLTWQHYRKLMVIPNLELRERLTAQAEKNAWSFEEVEAKVRYAIGKERELEKPEPLPSVALGEFHTYQIVRPESIHTEARALVIDCGFSLKQELDSFPGSTKFKEGMVVRSVKSEPRSRMQDSGKNKNSLPASWILQPVSQGNESLLYTYKAYVVDVIDADTLKVDFCLGFGLRKGETIRLNHIDCPEMNTPEGKAAKRFVEGALSGCEFITVKSIRTRKEKWGRYLGEVFLPQKEREAIYLNQLLLDKSHAVKLRG